MVFKLYTTFLLLSWLSQNQICKSLLIVTELLQSVIYTDRCNLLFKQVHEEKQVKGRSNDAVAAACLYIACRQEGVPRSFKGE